MKNGKDFKTISEVKECPSFTDSQDVSISSSRHFSLRILSTLRSWILPELPEEDMLEEHRTDHELSRNISQSHTLLNVAWKLLLLYVNSFFSNPDRLRQANTLLGSSQSTFWRCLLATTSRILEFYPYNSGYVRSYLAFFCWVCLRERKNPLSTPVQLFTHYQQVTGRVHAPETVKNACTSSRSS